MEREPKPRAFQPRPANAPRSVVGGGTTGLAFPKGEPAKPGKRSPTKDERAWMDAIVQYGCIACRKDGRGYVLPAVHHILRGGLRIGHKFTLPLCDPGHHQGGQQMGLISRHPWKARFEQQYGSEQFLLDELKAVLKKQPDGSYAP